MGRVRADVGEERGRADGVGDRERALEGRQPVLELAGDADERGCRRAVRHGRVVVGRRPFPEAVEVSRAERGEARQPELGGQVGVEGRVPRLGRRVERAARERRREMVVAGRAVVARDDVVEDEVAVASQRRGRAVAAGERERLCPGNPFNFAST